MNNTEDKVMSVFSLILNKDTHGNQDILNLYNMVDDMELFLRIVSRFSGRRVQFPTLKEIEDALTLALVYTYREQGMSWKEIQALMPVDFSPMGYSMKIKSLNSFILRSLKEAVKEDDNI